MKSGIYKILCLVNEKFYIGSSFDIPTRFKRHNYGLSNNRHPNRYLQYAWLKYGKDNFVFIILEYCEIEKLLEREQFYLDILKPAYNLNPTAGSMLGYKHSEENKTWQRLPKSLESNIKRSNTQKNQPKTLEHKIKIGIGNRKLDKWPHAGGNKCPCRECADRRYDMEKIAREKNPRKKKSK